MGDMCMFIFKAKALRKDWDGETLFESIDMELKRGEHLALFGRNGVGKTTLLDGLLGRTSFDAGKVQRFTPLEKWGMLEQDPVIDSEVTTSLFVQSGAKERMRLKQELEILQAQVDDQNAELLDNYNAVYEEFLAMDGYSLEQDTERCLQEVNLAERTWQTDFRQLSGGEKTRAQLARILMQKPACIVMDEPTNHLDQATIEWLESWMESYTGAILYVSHDRCLLDKTAHVMYELTGSSSERFVGGYSEYRKQKELQRRTQEALHQKQKQKRAALEQTIRNYQQWFMQAHKAAGQDMILLVRRPRKMCPVSRRKKRNWNGWKTSKLISLEMPKN